MRLLKITKFCPFDFNQFETISNLSSLWLITTSLFGSSSWKSSIFKLYCSFDTFYKEFLHLLDYSLLSQSNSSNFNAVRFFSLIQKSTTIEYTKQPSINRTTKKFSEIWQ